MKGKSLLGIRRPRSLWRSRMISCGGGKQQAETPGHQRRELPQQVAEASGYGHGRLDHRYDQA